MQDGRCVLDTKKVLEYVEKNKDRFSERELSDAVGKNKNWINSMRRNLKIGKTELTTSCKTAEALGDLLGIDVRAILTIHTSRNPDINGYWDESKFIKHKIDTMLEIDADPNHELILKLLTCLIITYATDKAHYVRMLLDELLKDERNHKNLNTIFSYLVYEPFDQFLMEEHGFSIPEWQREWLMENREAIRKEQFSTMTEGIKNLLERSTKYSSPTIIDNKSLKFEQKYWWLHLYFALRPQPDEIVGLRLKTVSQIIETVHKEASLTENPDYLSIIKGILETQFAKYDESTTRSSKIDRIAWELMLVLSKDTIPSFGMREEKLIKYCLNAVPDSSLPELEPIRKAIVKENRKYNRSQSKK